MHLKLSCRPINTCHKWLSVLIKVITFTLSLLALLLCIVFWLEDAGASGELHVHPPRVPFALAASASLSTTSHDEESAGTDYLMLEVELQDLMDRVAMFEAGYAHILEAQRLILENQEEIFGRLARLENNYMYNMYTPLVKRSCPV